MPRKRRSRTQSDKRSRHRARPAEAPRADARESRKPLSTEAAPPKSVEDLVRRIRDEIVSLVPSEEELQRLQTVSLELRCDIPVGQPNPKAIRRAAQNLVEQLRAQVRGQTLLQSLIQPGNALCLRCNHSACEHATPSSSSAVFAGYEPSGRPQWIEFNTRLTQGGDRRVDRLFAARPSVLCRVTPGRQLMSRLLPAFADGIEGCRLLGQVESGWIPTRDSGADARFAASFQLYLFGNEGQGLKIQLNPVARLPGGGSLEAKLREGGLPDLSSVLAVTRTKTDGMARQFGRRRGVMKKLEEEAMALLRDLARDLETAYRNQTRRTQHAQERSRSGARPTNKAFEDASAASDDGIRVDSQENTMIVLGKQQRVHVFSSTGQHITSVTYPTETIRFRTSMGRWRACRAEELALFRRFLQEEN